MDKRYQVFISSTYADLTDERSRVIRTVMELDCIPAGMELFPAIDEEQFEFIKRVIDACDYYLLIIGGRYGTVSPTGASYTEMEYDYALSRGLKVIALLHDSPDSIPFGKSEKDPTQREKLQQFRNTVAKGRLVKFWNKADELPALVSLSLSSAIRTYPAVGWVRGGAATSHGRQKLLTEEEVQGILASFSGDADDILLLGGDGSFLATQNPQVDVFRRSKKILLNSRHKLQVERLKELHDNGTEIRLYSDTTIGHGLRGAIKVADRGMAACLFDRKGQQFKHQEIDNRYLVSLIYEDFFSVFHKGKNALIKSVIFDLAGVMFDGDIVNFFKKVESITSINIANTSRHHLCVDERLNLGTTSIVGFIETKIGATLSPDQGAAIMREWNNTWTINEAMREIALGLKKNGYMVSLASNCDRENADVYELKNYLHIFDGLFFSYEMGELKPSRSFFDIMLNRLSLQSFECLFIDDHRSNIEVAKSLGFSCILVDRGIKPSDRAQHLIQQLSALSVYA